MTTVASIDIGTNSTRVLVARPDEAGKLDILDRRMTITRLGQARVTTDNLVIQEGDIGHFVVEVAALDRLRERLAAGKDAR